MSLGCAILARQEGARGIGRGYVADSAGSLGGGLLFSLVLVRWWGHIAILLWPGLVNLAAAVALARRFRLLGAGWRSGWWRRWFSWTQMVFRLASNTRLSAYVERADSPYGKLLVTQSEGQLDFIENGVPLISTRDDEHVKDDLPIIKQAKVLGLSRSSVYYLPQPVSPADLSIMRRLDELHLEFPFAGSRMLRDMLRAEGFTIGRCHVITLMRRMGIEAIYRKPNTSEARTRPQGLSLSAPESCRSPGPIRFGHRHHLHPDGPWFRLLTAIVDWFCRRVLSWRVSNSMETAFCVDCPGGGDCAPWQTGNLQHRPRKPVHQRSFHRRPEKRRNRHQHGRQGSWRDNVFVERLWRSIKYEEVYLKAYDFGFRGARLDRPVYRLLQFEETSFQS